MSMTNGNTLVRVCTMLDYDVSLDYGAYHGFHIVNGHNLNRLNHCGYLSG